MGWERGEIKTDKNSCRDFLTFVLFGRDFCRFPPPPAASSQISGFGVKGRERQTGTSAETQQSLRGRSRAVPVGRLFVLFLRDDEHTVSD